MIKDIIIKPNHGDFIVDKNLSKKIKECGYESIWQLEARMDERIIKFIQDRTGKKGKEVKYKGKEDKFGGFGFTYITIEQVDTSKLWMIDDYDSAEGIVYINIVNNDLNYCEVEYQY